MARDLRAVMPEIRAVLVIGNAGLVDRSLLALPLKTDSGELVLGHLSNLYLEKGIAEVVDLATALHKAGTRIRLLVGGPVVHMGARPHLDRAAHELGDLFEYRGPLSGEAKRAFFDEITHFVFPSHYIHESAPLVLYEAMAAGAVCVTTRRGSISEQLEGTASLIAENQNSFVRETLPSLVGAATSSARSQESKLAYINAVSKSDAQLDDFIALISAGP
jgi:glycosyltransferase involved in cell wall biosynthesis